MKRLLGALLVAGGVLAFCADIPVNGITQAWTSNASTAAACSNNNGQSSAYFSVAATATAGPLDAQMSGDGANWVAADIYDKSGTKQSQPFTPATAIPYRVFPAGVKYVRVAPDSTYASQSTTVTIRCTAASEPFAPGVISSLPPVVISSLPPVSNNCISNCTPSPTTTISPGLYVGVTNACPSTAPAQVNGAYTCTNDSTGRLQVSTPVPYPTTSQFPTPILAHGFTGVGNALIPTAPIYCNNATPFGTSSNGAIQIAASVVGDVIYVCGISAIAAGGSQMQLAAAAGAACTTLTTLAAIGVGTWADTAGVYHGIKVPAGQALCVNSTGAITSFIGTVYWTQASPGP